LSGSWTTVTQVYFAQYGALPVAAEFSVSSEAENNF